MAQTEIHAPGTIPFRPQMTDVPDPLDDDADEYELEPVDPEILEMERQRAEQKVRQAEQKAEIDELYAENQPSEPLTLADFERFRFTTRHLLIGTALLAVFLTLAQRGGCFALFVAACFALAVGWYLVLRKERREKLALEQRRAEAAQRHGEGTFEQVDYSEFEEPATEVEPSFQFSFSLKQLLGAMTVAALVFGLVRLLGGADNAALLLGTIALLGLVIHLLGFDPPPVIVLGWWLLLVLYIVVSLWAAFGPAKVAAIDLLNLEPIWG